MKLLQIRDYPFNEVTLDWKGPFNWPKRSGGLRLPEELRECRGLYRAETESEERSIIKYIGSASEGFNKRLTSQHRVYKELVNGSRSQIRIYVAAIECQRRLRLFKTHYVEIEYIMQQAHWHDLISWHGLSKLPKTQRGEGWRITNKGRRGHIYRVVAYPAFAVAGQDRG